MWRAVLRYAKSWLGRNRLKQAHLKACADYFAARNRGDKRGMHDAWERAATALHARLEARV